MYKWQVDLLIWERDKLKNKIVKMTLSMLHTFAREVTPTSIQGTKQLTKLSNLPILMDRKDLKFEDWLSQIKDKLLVNEDYYSTN